MKTETEVKKDELSEDEINAILAGDFSEETKSEETESGSGAEEISLEEAEFSDLVEFMKEPDEVEAEVEAEAEAEAEAEVEAEVEVEAEAEAEATPKTPRVTTAGMSPSEALAAKFDESVMSVIDADTLAAYDSAPKKVGEKILNVYSHINNGVLLSTYTRVAIDLLRANPEIDVKDIKAMYTAHPYAKGTVEAQASQMMKLLPVLGIAEREGTRLVLNEDSEIFKTIVGISSTES